MEVYELDRQCVLDAQRQGWQGMRVFQGEPTIDLLRYEISGDDDALVIEGNETLVPGLSGLEAAVFPIKRKRKEVRGHIEYAESDVDFVIYDIEALLTDQILYQGLKYEVMKTDYNAQGGRCRIEASKVK